MDFFQQQESARKRTKLLVMYYILAVIFIIAGVYAVTIITVLYFRGTGDGTFVWGHEVLWDPWVLLWTTAAVGGLIGGGTVYKIASLKGGGRAVVRMMGGEPISSESEDMDERQLLNVVEEMAIASGVPVPPVYVIEDKAINAFAAGFTPSDAVIGVTRRCVDELDRDELQGVIAHEFSHILYGDMRLNLRLIGVLFGILLVSVTGRLILHASFYGRGRRSRSRGRISAGRGQLAILLLGVSLLIIGSIGVFFGRLIK
ncbi:MAG: M48 family metalloprotease, partial [Planctomycetota bacterium]